MEWHTPPEHPHYRRQKRSHAEMSQGTLSPSPITFRGPESSSFAGLPQYNPSALANNDLFFERRRTSHPHNHSIIPPRVFAEDMPQRSQTQSQQHPRLEHRASQTLIDLTEDPEDIPGIPRMRAPSQRPPQLGRSDTQHLADVIDLTEDDVEVQITGARNRELPLPGPDVARPRPHAPFPRPDSPGLFVPIVPPQPARNLHRVFPAAGAFTVLGRNGMHVRDILREGNVLAQMMEHAQQAMPNQMDYRYPAFVDRKPDHIPPEPAKPGFTRSPTENDIVVCPSCEEELIHNKEFDGPVVKKGGKAPTRKEREEHPFWVIKECGHVYCNCCYQNRVPNNKQRGNVSFPEKTTSAKGSKKVPMCAVENCQSEVKNKEKWIGVFL